MTTEVVFTGQSGRRWRYWSDQSLGAPGGFGGVYAAEAEDGLPMAVKVVKKQHLSGMLDDRLLRREIDIGRRVAERGSDLLLPVIDAADTGGELLLVMARAEGALSSIATPVTDTDTMFVMTDIATALQQLHSLGIIHRDLKPANVLRYHGRWTLADFGIARDQEIGTQDPTFLGWGSPPYMAPELWQNQSPTIKTDLYALGCLGFELLTGTPPYTGDHAAIRAGHLTKPHPDLPASNVALRNLTTRLIAKDPGDRPQDARSVLERLQRSAMIRSPLLDDIERGLATHVRGKATAAAQVAAEQEASKILRQQIAQANGDLREIMSDALEELQGVEPDAVLRFGEGEADFLTISAPDAALMIRLFSSYTRDYDFDFKEITKSIRSLRRRGSTIVLVGVIAATNSLRTSGLSGQLSEIYKNNRWQPRSASISYSYYYNDPMRWVTVAYLAYEQVGDHLAWRIYWHSDRSIKSHDPIFCAKAFLQFSSAQTNAQSIGFSSWYEKISVGNFIHSDVLNVFRIALDLTSG